MVEHFGRQIEGGPQSYHSLGSGEELETQPRRSVLSYSQRLLQLGLGSKTRLLALEKQDKFKLTLLKKTRWNLPAWTAGDRKARCMKNHYIRGKVHE